MREVVFFLLALIAGCSTGAAGPSGYNAVTTNAAPQTESPPVASAQPNSSDILIAVSESANRPVPRLRAAELRLYRDHKPAIILSVSPEPVSVAILIDTSGSMQPKLRPCASALRTFIGSLNPSGELSLFTFSNRPFMLQKPTTNHELVLARLTTLNAFGRTALYDALLDILRSTSASRFKRKAVVLITDGMDDASTSSMDQAEESARLTRIPIYAIGIGNPDTRTSSWFGASHDVEALDTKALSALAKDSGGQMFVVTLRDEGTALTAALGAVAERIGNRFIVRCSGSASGHLRIEAPGYKTLRFKIVKS